MRMFIPSIAVALFVTSLGSTQTVDFTVVKLNDAGAVEISKTILQQRPVVKTLVKEVPVQFIQNGQAIVRMQAVTETITVMETTKTTAFAPMKESDGNFTDLQGKPVAFADVKKSLQKGAIAVISLPKDAPPLSAAIVQVFREGTLILRTAPEPIPVPRPAAPALPFKLDEEK